MITLQDIIENSKPHSGIIGGRMLKIKNEDVTFSIVGGGMGLYGDFKNDFEIAVFDNETNRFITEMFFPNSELGGVASYIRGEELVETVNSVFSKGGFQFS